MSSNGAAFGVNGEPIEKNTDTAKCPSCGAEMVFSPEEQKLSCPYCGFLKEIDFSKTSSEIPFDQLFTQKNEDWGSETHVFRCENCGAKEVINSNEIAKECPFCGTTNITQTEEISGLKPNGVVPFAIKLETAIKNVKAWAKKRLFAPKAFKQSAKPEKVKGTYMPAFTFDSYTFTYYTGVLGKYYTKTRRVNGKTQTYRVLRTFVISGTFDCRFDDVLIQANNRITQRQIEKISPFETNSSNEYSSEFLHGYTAQSNERGGDECWEDAKVFINSAIRSKILSRYVYDVVESFSPQTSFSEVTYKYLLLPVYVGHCNWKSKLYNFFVNGKNGKVTGKSPVSPLKVAIAVLLGLAVVAGVALLISLGGG